MPNPKQNPKIMSNSGVISSTRDGEIQGFDRHISFHPQKDEKQLEKLSKKLFENQD